MNFGQRFKSLLKREGISQKEYCEKTKMNPGLLSRYINGESPSGDFIMKAVKAFPNDLDFLFLESDDAIELAKEPNTKYETPVQIVEDIEKKLNHLKWLLSQK